MPLRVIGELSAEPLSGLPDEVETAVVDGHPGAGHEDVLGADRTSGVTDPALLRAPAGLYDHAGRHAEAVDAWNQVLAVAPTDADVRYTVGILRHKLGQGTNAADSSK